MEKKIKVFTFQELLPNQKKYNTVYLQDYSFQNSDPFKVPDNHYFFLVTIEIVQKTVDF